MERRSCPLWVFEGLLYMSDSSDRRSVGRREAEQFLEKLAAQKWDAVAVDALRPVPTALGCNARDMRPGTAAQWELIRCGSKLNERAVKLLLDFAGDFNH